MRVMVSILLFSGYLFSGAQSIIYSPIGMALQFNDSTRSDFIYTEIGPFKEGFAWVNKGEWYGFINSQGDSITGFQFEVVRSFHHRFALVGIGDSISYINKQGDTITPFQFIEGRDFNGEFAAVRTEKGWGMIDTSGQLVVPCIYDSPPLVEHPHFIRVRREGKWGVINSKGEVLFNTDYTYIGADSLAYRFQHKAKLYPPTSE
jgi:hypothetical protein